MEYDFVVIGGGHNGLVAANYLARAGRSVIVLEQRAHLGGMASTRARVVEAPRHHLSQGAIDSVFIKTTTIMEDLALPRHGLELIEIDPSYGWMGEDGETLCVFRSPEQTATEISRFSKKDARRYLEVQGAFSTILDLQNSISQKSASAIGAWDLAKAVLRLTGDRPTRKLVQRLASCSAYEAIAEMFESDALRSLFAYWTEIACPADVEGSGIYISSLSIIHRVGCSRPIGGIGSLINALAQSLSSRGGVIRLDAEVEEVLIESDRACGIRLRDGTHIRARSGVLASCPPQTIYNRLLPPRMLSENSASRVPFMPANVNNMCPFKVDMAIGDRIGFRKAQERRRAFNGGDIGASSMMTGTFEEHIEHAAALRRGAMGPKPPIWMTVLSYADRSLAPEGQDVLYLHTHAPSDPGGGWREHSDGVAGRLVASASGFLDGLDKEIGRCVTSPSDFEEQYGTPRGCLYHVDMLPSRLAGNRPAVGMGGSRSEVRNLYLAGSGSHPGGGVFGMPGKLAAICSLQDGR